MPELSRNDGNCAQGRSGSREQTLGPEGQLTERIHMHVVQLRRYEAGTSQPTLDVIRKLSTALQASAELANLVMPLEELEDLLPVESLNLLNWDWW